MVAMLLLHEQGERPKTSHMIQCVIFQHQVEQRARDSQRVEKTLGIKENFRFRSLKLMHPAKNSKKRGIVKESNVNPGVINKGKLKFRFRVFRLTHSGRKPEGMRVGQRRKTAEDVKDRGRIKGNGKTSQSGPDGHSTRIPARRFQVESQIHSEASRTSKCFNYKDLTSEGSPTI